jgi:hypothetical protein
VISMFFAWRSFYGMRIGTEVTVESLRKGGITPATPTPGGDDVKTDDQAAASA